eukprot:Rmarinus@m.2755
MGNTMGNITSTMPSTIPGTHTEPPSFHPAPGETRARRPSEEVASGSAVPSPASDTSHVRHEHSSSSRRKDSQQTGERPATATNSAKTTDNHRRSQTKKTAKFWARCCLVQ